MKYGAYIKLNANTSKTASGSENIANELKMYLESNIGKVEVGTMSPVGSSMEVNSYSLARATGGLDGEWSLWIKNGGVVMGDKTVDARFLTAPQLPVGFDETTKAAKINYFSPEINGFTFGLTYVPDSKSKGTVNQTREQFKNSGGGYKNVFQPTVRYQTKFANGVNFTTALLGDFGQAKDEKYINLQDIGEKKPTSHSTQRHNLNAWQLGASIEYEKIAFSGAYGNVGKSGAPKIDGSKNKGEYWTLGSAYATDQYGISINYMQSKRAGQLAGMEKKDGKDAKVQVATNTEYNRFSALSIGADYQVMPGFMPYVELTKFNFKKNNNFGPDAKFNRGTVFLAGTKIKF
jgi:predicted porin